MKNKDREKDIIRLYTEEGETCTNISKIVKIQRKNVYLILERNGVQLRKSVNIKCSICRREITNNSRKRTKCGTCMTKVRRYIERKTSVEYLGNKCKRCDWSGDISGFDFHHRVSEEKSFGISALTVANKTWKLVKQELDKCDLLCALCHRLEHSDYQNENLIKESKNYSGILFKE